MNINRTLSNSLKNRLFSGKALLLNGPRQVGKTTLIKNLIEKSGKSYQFFNADNPSIKKLLTSPNTEQLKQILGEQEIIFIDEAQRLPEFGLTAKLITDEFSDKQLILSGSSSFELSQQMQEPLTGRKWTFELFPISWEEWQNHIGYVKAEQDLENRLVYGFYPDVLTQPQDQNEILIELVNSYLYKDVLSYAGLRKPDVIQKLVQALAYQVGSEVSYRELSEMTKLHHLTVENYIDILEKAYIVFRLKSYSGNLRSEIKMNRKIYFYDNGVRNAVIGELKPVANRQDVGALWENFLIAERLKQLRYQKRRADMHFWRTKQQQEIDYVEVKGKDAILAAEFKWNSNRKIKFSKTFTNNYEAETLGVYRENFRKFVLPKFG